MPDLGLPTRLVNQDVFPQDWDKILQIEGYPLALFGNTATGTVTASGAINTGIAGSSQPPLIGKIPYIDTATVVADGAGVMQLGIGGDPIQRFPGFAYQFITAPNIPVTIPVKQLIRPYMFQNGILSVSCRNNLTAGSVTYKCSVSANCRVITDDTNFSADHVIMCASDSTWNGTGPTATWFMAPFLLRDFLRSRGFNCRVVLKTVSGSTSNDHEIWRKAGWHAELLQRPSMGIYNLGLNDAGNGVARATHLANVQAFWTWWSARFPNAPLIILGPTPTELDSTEALSANYRSDVSAWVTSVASPRLKYADPTALWDRKVASNYAGSDTPGSRVHYSDGPHALVAGLLQSVITANNLWPSR